MKIADEGVLLFSPITEESGMLMVWPALIMWMNKFLTSLDFISQKRAWTSWCNLTMSVCFLNFPGTVHGEASDRSYVNPYKGILRNTHLFQDPWYCMGVGQGRKRNRNEKDTVEFSATCIKQCCQPNHDMLQWSLELESDDDCLGVFKF